MVLFHSQTRRHMIKWINTLWILGEISSRISQCQLLSMNVNCSASIYSKPRHLLIVETCQPVTPPLQDNVFICLRKKKATLWKSLRNCIIGLLTVSADNIIIFAIYKLPYNYFNRAFKIPTILAAMFFPIIHLVMTLSASGSKTYLSSRTSRTRCYRTYLTWVLEP